MIKFIKKVNNYLDGAFYKSWSRKRNVNDRYLPFEEGEEEEYREYLDQHRSIESSNPFYKLAFWFYTCAILFGIGWIIYQLILDHLQKGPT